MQAGSSVESDIATLLLGSIGGTNAVLELVDADISTGERVEGRSFTQVRPACWLLCHSVVPTASVHQLPSMITSLRMDLSHTICIVITCSSK